MIKRQDDDQESGITLIARTDRNYDQHGEDYLRSRFIQHSSYVYYFKQFD